jgi:hypothetical protein
MSHDRSIGGTHPETTHSIDNWTEASTRATARDAVGTRRLESARHGRVRLGPVGAGSGARDATRRRRRARCDERLIGRAMN